jgi:hypothetical protein
MFEALLDEGQCHHRIAQAQGAFQRHGVIRASIAQGAER